MVSVALLERCDPTHLSDDADDKDDAANKKAGLLLYIVIGTLCGALTGLMLLTMLRICLQCLSSRRRPTDDADTRDSAAMRDAVGRRLVLMPIRPYPQLKQLGQLKIHCDDDAEMPCAVCLDDMRLSNRCRQLPCNGNFDVGSSFSSRISLTKMSRG